MRPVKILTVCSQGLVRSVALADVLKMHFEPADVLPVGIDSNSRGTVTYLSVEWADHVIAMHEPFYKRLNKWIQEFGLGIEVKHPKVHLCEVGSDTYHNSRHRNLVDQVWNWTRQNQNKLGIKEHNRKV